MQLLDFCSLSEHCMVWSFAEIFSVLEPRKMHILTVFRGGHTYFDCIWFAAFLHYSKINWFNNCTLNSFSLLIHNLFLFYFAWIPQGLNCLNMVVLCGRLCLMFLIECGGKENSKNTCARWKSGSGGSFWSLLEVTSSRFSFCKREKVPSGMYSNMLWSKLSVWRLVIRWINNRIKETFIIVSFNVVNFSHIR